MRKLKVGFWAKFALFGATLIWGSSFVIVKDVVNSIPTYFLLAIRFFLAGIILSVIFYRRLHKIDFQYIWNGALLGGLIFIAYAFQTFGIGLTTPGKNAFLTAIYCVIVPFLFWALGQKRPDRYNITAAVLCISGIGLVSLTSDFTVGMGDALTLCGGFFYAAHIVAVAKFSKDRDAVVITIFQFYFSGLFALLFSLITEERWDIVWNTQLVFSVGYLVLLCTAAGLLMQNFGQKYTHPAAASIILSLESVFGVAFSVVFYQETLTKRIFTGFILIFVSVIVSETKLSFVKKPLCRLKSGLQQDKT